MQLNVGPTSCPCGTISDNAPVNRSMSSTWLKHMNLYLILNPLFEYNHYKYFGHVDVHSKKSKIILEFCKLSEFNKEDTIIINIMVLHLKLKYSRNTFVACGKCYIKA